MGQPLVVRYSVLRKPGPWKVFPDEEIRDDLQDWHKGYKVRKVGTVTVLDYSGVAQCEEVEIPVHEYYVTTGLFHVDGTGRWIRHSRVLISYMIHLKGVAARYQPANYRMGCPTCLEEPVYPDNHGNHVCPVCQPKWRCAVVPVIDCNFVDPGLLKTFCPQAFTVTAEWGSRPFKEELMVKAMNPERPNFLESVLDVEELKDFNR